MIQIFVAMLVGVCSKDVGQLWLWIDRENFSDEVTEGWRTVRAEKERIE